MFADNLPKVPVDQLTHRIATLERAESDLARRIAVRRRKTSDAPDLVAERLARLLARAGARRQMAVAQLELRAPAPRRGVQAAQGPSSIGR